MRKHISILNKVIIYIAATIISVSQPIAAFATTEGTSEQYDQPSTVTLVDSTPSIGYEATPAEAEEQMSASQPSPDLYIENDSPAQEPAPLTIIEPAPVSSSDSPEQLTGQSTSNNTETDVKIIHGVSSDAQSGDALIDSNTIAGSAASGDAKAVANVLNIINSTMNSGENQKVASFTKDIMGDVKGDIILYPMLLKSMLEAQADNSFVNTIDTTTNFDVTNEIDLHAQSGDATVTRNSQAGGAASGTATAVANVVNILNSMIATQESFIGTINIYGNLEGDILLAPDFIPQMLANNSDAAMGSSPDSSTILSSDHTTRIVNNISAVAESGAASVFNNTTAGTAESGDALSNVVIFNLSGHEIIAKNSLLVFVNVLGKWVGVIVDAPAGATAALVGNGVDNHMYNPDIKVISESNHSITNTISVVAQSGDAEVSYNTIAGGAVSGQAKAMANVANVSGSQFSLTDWFGVLFINVFQNWYGSFGVNTTYGDPPVIPDPPAQPHGPIVFVPAEEDLSNVETVRLATFSGMSSSSGPLAPDYADDEEPAAVLGSSQTVALPSAMDTSSSELPNEMGLGIWALIAAGVATLTGLAITGIRRLRAVA